MLTLLNQKLSQNELDAIEKAYAILRNAQFKMNELFNRLSDELPSSDVTYEIIKLSDGLDAVERASEILVMFAKLVNETKFSPEND